MISNQDLNEIAYKERQEFYQAVSTSRGIIELCKAVEEVNNYRPISKYDYCPGLARSFGGAKLPEV